MFSRLVGNSAQAESLKRDFARLLSIPSNIFLIRRGFSR